MKKSFLTILALVCSFSIFANTTVSSIALDNGCRDYAIAAADAEEAHYGEFGCSEEYFETAMWYYDLCNDSGGAGGMLDPVLL